MVHEKDRVRRRATWHDDKENGDDDDEDADGSDEDESENDADSDHEVRHNTSSSTSGSKERKVRKKFLFEKCDLRGLVIVS